MLNKPWQADANSAKEVSQHLLYDSNKSVNPQTIAKKNKARKVEARRNKAQVILKVRFA